MIAELLAAHAYLTLSKYAPEPVLADITRKIAGDEARHAAHFFGYGKRLLARCEHPALEQKNALEVLICGSIAKPNSTIRLVRFSTMYKLAPSFALV